MSTTSPDLDALTAVAVNILASKALPSFPTTTRAHPSFYVWVHPTSDGPIREQDGVFFPYSVRWDIWQKVMVPVMRNPEFSPQNTFIKDQMGTDLERYYWRLNQAISAAMIEHGYLPEPLEEEGVGEEGITPDDLRYREKCNC
jgi:hypothetical protein